MWQPFWKLKYSAVFEPFKLQLLSMFPVYTTYWKQIAWLTVLILAKLSCVLIKFWHHFLHCFEAAISALLCIVWADCLVTEYLISFAANSSNFSYHRQVNTSDWHFNWSPGLELSSLGVQTAIKIQFVFFVLTIDQSIFCTVWDLPRLVSPSLNLGLCCRRTL